MTTTRTVLTASLMFVPASIAVFTQSVWVTLVLWLSSLTSLMYHISGEEDHYGFYDSVFASIAIMMAFYSVAALVYLHGWSHWRVLLPILTGITAILVYIFLANKSIDHLSDDDYHDYHAIWHILIASVAIFLYMKPVDHSVLSDLSYHQVFHHEPKEKKWI